MINISSIDNPRIIILTITGSSMNKMFSVLKKKIGEERQSPNIFEKKVIFRSKNITHLMSGRKCIKWLRLEQSWQLLSLLMSNRQLRNFMFICLIREMRIEFSFIELVTRNFLLRCLISKMKIGFSFIELITRWIPM